MQYCTLLFNYLLQKGWCAVCTFCKLMHITVTCMPVNVEYCKVYMYTYQLLVHVFDQFIMPLHSVLKYLVTEHVML